MKKTYNTLAELLDDLNEIHSVLTTPDRDVDYDEDYDEEAVWTSDLFNKSFEEAQYHEELTAALQEAVLSAVKKGNSTDAMNFYTIYKNL